MSNNLRLEILLKAVDQATRPLKSIQAASKTLSGDIRDTQKGLRDLNDQASKINGFRETSAQLAVTSQALDRAKREAGELAVRFKNATNPTRAQAQALEAAKRAASELQTQYNELRISVQRQRTGLMQAGINTRSLSADQRRLKASINETTAQLNRQREALARVRAQQARLSQVKARYETGQKLASGARNAGMAGVGVAMKGLNASSQFIAPGIDFDKQMSGTQAILDLSNSDEKLAAIRQQARDIGAKTGVSPGNVALTQTTLARSGYDADAVLAATGSTINLSLAAEVDTAEAADIITSIQSAFNLSTTEVERVTDVMTEGFTSSKTGLIEFTEAMKSVAPTAEAAGASIEDTAAVIGILADNDIKGSMAGTSASAIFSRLQAPQGQASDALKELSVTTQDNNGNMLPVEKILSDIHRSFDKNQLGSAQQAEYLKVIFGEEAMAGAVKLVAAAGNGQLAEKRNQIGDSKGTTARIAKIQTNNLDGDLKKLQSASENLQIEVFEKEDSALRKLTTSATGWVDTLRTWTKANPELTKTLFTVVTGALAFIGVIGGIGLIAWPIISGINVIITAAGFLGTAFTVVGSAIVTALGAITWPIVAIGLVIVAGALLIRKYWEPISAFFSGVIEGVISAFAPVGEMFTPLTPIFDELGEKLGGVWQCFKDLIAPIKTTQETLDSCKNVGVIFGQALASALTAPLDVFNKLRSGVDWLLEKLGIISKESDILDQTAIKTNAATQGNSYIPATSSYGGYQAYQPVTAPAGRSYVDQSKSEYNITLSGGIAPGHQLDRQLRDTVEQIDREKRARARANMSHD